MRTAFTLVELMVVITIIVNLLAPAMDLAIYQSELAATKACRMSEHGRLRLQGLPSLGVALNWYQNP